jgi:hypothetical protein
MSMLQGDAHADLQVVYTVNPVPGGWAIGSGPHAEPLMFFSGARAEATACALAKATASAGLAADVVVHDRNGQVAGAYRYRTSPGLSLSLVGETGKIQRS